MWWGLIVSVVFLYPAVEFVEERRLLGAAKKDLVEMRKHIELGHQWDITRGQWTA
jgi:hypothetical protein